MYTYTYIHTHHTQKHAHTHTYMYVYLQQEVYKDGRPSVERESPNGWHGGDGSKKKGGRLRQRSEEEAWSNVTQSPSHQFLG